jgi:hypothetical protein
VERKVIISLFWVDAQIVENARDIRVGSHKNSIPVLKLTLEIGVQMPKILLLRLIIKRKNYQI